MLKCPVALSKAPPLMKNQSDEVFERVNEGSLRLDQEAKSFRLKGFHWRDALPLIIGLAGSLIMLTGVNVARQAVFAKELLVDNDGLNLQQELQAIEESVSLSAALTQAIREGDQDAVQRCQKNLEAFEERKKERQAGEARRLAERGQAEKALRKRYGAAAAGLMVVGFSLACVARSLGRRERRTWAEPGDAMDSR